MKTRKEKPSNNTSNNRNIVNVFRVNKKRNKDIQNIIVNTVMNFYV